MTWTHVTDVPEARSDGDFASAVDGGVIYVYHRYFDTGLGVVVQVFHSYDPVTATWVALTAPTVDAVNPTLIPGATGKLLRFDQFGVNVYEYDIATDAWTFKTSWAGGADQMYVTTGGGVIYVAIVHFSDPNGISNIAVYDPSTNTWDSGSVLPVPTTADGFGGGITLGYLAAHLSQPDRLVITNGWYNQPAPAGETAYLDLTNISAGWTTGAPNPVPRYSAAPYWSGLDVALVVGGNDVDGNPLVSARVYDPALDVWRAVPDLPVALSGSGSAVVGSDLYAVGGQDTGLWMLPLTALHPSTGLPAAYAELRVYDRNGLTLRDTIGARGVSWVDEVGAAGNAQFTVAAIQAVLLANPDLLRDGIVKVAVPLDVGEAPTEIFGWLTDPGHATLIAAAEDADKEFSPTCRGITALLDDWVVYPEAGLRRTSADHRVFGWMSASGAWLNPADWTVPPNSLLWSSVTSTLRAKQPSGWPDPSAKWIYDPLFHYNLFRSTFTLASDTAIRVYASADELLNVYLDSEQIIAVANEEIGYTYLNTYDVVLPAGTHTLAAETTQVPTALTGDGIDAFICTVMTVDDAGNPVTVLRHTDTTNWTYHGVHGEDPKPGWTAASILLELISEATTRGVPSAASVTASFTDADDSNGDAWPDLQERSVLVGTSGSHVAAEIGEVAFDLDLRPDMSLHAYIEQGVDRTATVALVRGVNIVSYTWDGQPLLATRLLVLTAEGWVEQADTTAEAGGDRRESFLQTGQSLSIAQGQLVGSSTLADMARERYTYTAQIIAVTGAVPYRDFGKGDTVMGYDRSGVAAAVKVVSISGQVPDEGGPVIWTLELEEP